MVRALYRNERFVAVAAAAVLVLFPAVADKSWLNLAVFVGIYVVLTSGLVLLFGYANQLSFGHAGFFGIGAYASAIASAYVTPWGGFAVGMLLAGAVGYLIGRPIVGLKGLSLGLATLAFGQIMHTLFTELPITGGATGLPGIPSPSIGSFAFDTAARYYWLVLVAAAATFVFARRIGTSRSGRALRALGQNEAAALAAGVDVVRAKTAIVTLSATLAGLSGALYAHYVTFISADSFRGDFSILVVLIVAVGGKDSLFGAILGSILLTAAPYYLRGFEQYSMLLYGLLLIVVFMYLPRGLVGLFRLRTADAP